MNEGVVELLILAVISFLCANRCGSQLYLTVPGGALRFDNILCSAAISYRSTATRGLRIVFSFLPYPKPPDRLWLPVYLGLPKKVAFSALLRPTYLFGNEELFFAKIWALVTGFGAMIVFESRAAACRADSNV